MTEWIALIGAWFVNAAIIIVAITWFYAYSRVRVRPFAVLGAATLILLVNRKVSTFLHYCTDIDYFLAFRVGDIANISTGLIFAVLAVYGIIKLEKYTREEIRR